MATAYGDRGYLYAKDPKEGSCRSSEEGQGHEAFTTQRELVLSDLITNVCVQSFS